jgi:hypothetical protein
MNENEPTTLSPAARARRDAMLDDLVHELNATQRRRRARRRVLATAFCLGAVLLAIRFWPIAADRPGGPRQTASRDRDPAPPRLQPVIRRSESCVTMIVPTDPTVLERFRASPPRRVVRIDDRALEETLRTLDLSLETVREDSRIQSKAS